MDALKQQADQFLGTEAGYWTVVLLCFVGVLVRQGFDLSPMVHGFLNPDGFRVESVLRLHELDYAFDWAVHVITVPFLVVGVVSVVLKGALLSFRCLAITSALSAGFFAWAMDAPVGGDGAYTVADRTDDILLYSAFVALILHFVLFMFRRSMALRIKHFGMFLTLAFVLFIQGAVHGSVVLANFGMNKAQANAMDIVLKERSPRELLPLCRAEGRICFTLDPINRALTRTGSEHAVPNTVVQNTKTAILDYGILYDPRFERVTTRLRIKGISQINGATFINVYKAEENGVLLVLANWHGPASSGYAVHTGVLSLALLYLLVPCGWTMIKRSHGSRR